MSEKIKSKVCTTDHTSNPVILTRYIDEELIKYGWDEDVWFHVDNLSSAHIYVRLPEGQDWESIDQGLLVDCAQLTKANSIEGTMFSLMSTEFFKKRRRKD